tara:strand:- start:435 stop:1034 length:600 start_codon:yes stop_codon:yes gene_type:complete
MTGSGNLPAINPGVDQCKLSFWTIEANPQEDVASSKKRLAKIFKGIKNLEKCHVARELSSRGYHHFHVAVKFKKNQRYPNLIKLVQREMQFDKPNGQSISVRVFKTRQGANEDYDDLVKYITEKKYKSEENCDPDVLVVSERPCTYCGTTGKCAKLLYKERDYDIFSREHTYVMRPYCKMQAEHPLGRGIMLVSGVILS